MRVRISRSVLDAIRQESAAAAPREACGLLFGDADAITACQATENVSETPHTRFEIDPAALFAALRSARSGGAQVAGYWHSHPGGSAEPSPTDAAMAEGDGRLWLIVGAGAVKAWRATPEGPVHGRFVPVPIDPGD